MVESARWSKYYRKVMVTQILKGYTKGIKNTHFIVIVWPTLIPKQQILVLFVEVVVLEKRDILSTFFNTEMSKTVRYDLSVTSTLCQS